MELTNDFEVPLPLVDAWDVLTDLARIAPCMPGAELREVDGDDYKGVVKVKVGPIGAQYNGTARITKKDETARRAVLTAEGRETRGQGNARATVTAELTPSGETTKVSLTTDLHITGKVAQFGRGVLADISTKLLEQFARNLEEMIRSTASAPATGTPSESEAPEASGAGGVPGANGASGGSGASGLSGASGASGAAGELGSRTATSPPYVKRGPAPNGSDSLDLLRVAGPPVARRLAPVVGGILLAVVALALLRRLLRD